MSHIGRDSFVANLGRRGPLDVKGPAGEAAGTVELRRAGLPSEELARIAGQDGLISGRSELEELFALVDELDRNGSRSSLATTRSGADGRTELTASGRAYQ